VQFRTAEIVAHLGATLVGPDVTVDGASIDTRSANPGQLYVPIVAERDGHDFIPAAIAAGCPAYLTSRASVAPVGSVGTVEGATAIVVDDTGAALMRLGTLARGRIGGEVTGITGSVGKTTTKDILARCLASTFSTSASERSFNNELGLPLTLLNAPEDVQMVVLEMGARGFGHIARLTSVARPQVGIVTSVASAHVEYLGDLDGVARAKGELVEGLPPSGVAVLNVDDARVVGMAEFSPCPVLGYSVRGDAVPRNTRVDTDRTHDKTQKHIEAQVIAEDVSLDAELRPSFRLVTPWGSARVQLSLRGVQQVGNALAASSAALWCGVPLEALVTAMADVSASPLRMEVRRPRGGPTLLVDCYNANPASTEAALRSLAALPAARRVALLGVMAELGADTASEHGRIAEVAEALGIDLVGYETDLYGSRSIRGIDEAVKLLRSADPVDAVLVKGSRVARLEEVVGAFDGQSPSPTASPAASRSTREESSP
jgi:UDP-N-acetylmuramoyl-tripeptide--D-alanyl-D-alanine ligase